MKFILKDNLIHIVGSHGFPNNNIEAEVEAPGFEDYSIEYSVNGDKYRPLKNKKITIESHQLNKTSIVVSMRMLKDEKYLYFKSDTIPLTHTIIFGGTLEDKYPEILKDILKKIKNLEEKLEEKHRDFSQGKANLEKHTIDSIKTVEQKVKETLSEVVDTFEEITRKGSLF